MTQDQVIRRISKNKHGVVTLVIPKRFTRECDLAEPTDIVIVKQHSGLFVRKLREEEIE